MESSVAPATHVVRCPLCRQELGVVAGSAEVREVCPSCRREFRVRRFAFSRSSLESLSKAETALEGEAACFFHPEKKALRGCDRCGRFVCGLCDMPFGGRHLCPSCIGSGLESDKVPELVSRRLVWGDFALVLGILPVLLSITFWPLMVVTGPAAVFTGPAAVFMGLWGWKKPGSVVRGRRRWTAVLGIITGVIQIVIVLLAILAIWKGENRG